MSKQYPILSMKQMRDDYKDLYANGVNPRAVDLSEWIPWFDGRVRPIVPGEVVVFLADTGCGKTTVLQNIAIHACSHLRVLVFELELPSTLMYERFAQIEHDKTGQEVEFTYREARELNTYKTEHIWCCPESMMSSIDLEEAIVQAEGVMGGKPDVVMIDYIGLMTATGARGRTEQMSQLSIDIKRIAKHHDVVMITTSQISRPGEEGKKKSVEVFLHDARDSGQIENSAGLLVGMWRDPDNPSAKIWMKVCKNTKGMGGDKECFVWDGAKLKLMQAMRQPGEE